MHVNLMDITVDNFLDQSSMNKAACSKHCYKTKHSKNRQITPKQIHPDIEIYLILLHFGIHNKNKLLKVVV